MLFRNVCINHPAVKAISSSIPSSKAIKHHAITYQVTDSWAQMTMNGAQNMGGLNQCHHMLADSLKQAAEVIVITQGDTQSEHKNTISTVVLLNSLKSTCRVMRYLTAIIGDHRTGVL